MLLEQLVAVPACQTISTEFVVRISAAAAWPNALLVQAVESK
jgi:hypothetical protein